MPDIPFPLSSTPGSRIGEGEGRLINAYAEKVGNTIYHRRVPGLLPFASTGQSVPRGFLDTPGGLYAAFGGGVVRIAPDGTSTTLTGVLTGQDGVTFARNTNGDIVAARENGGAYLVTASAVSNYPDANLPGNVNSVTDLSGYFVWSTPEGRIFASNLNSTVQNPLSFASAESRPDGLKRVIRSAGRIYAMGTSTIEPWIDNGDSPFPFLRGTSIIPVGLLTTMAVAGLDEGWDHNPFFVAHDGTVRSLEGYTAKVVSTPDVERFIAASYDVTLEASVYTFRGNAIWSLSSNVGTWEFNVSTGQWHERISQGLNGWRGSRSVKSNGAWIIGDRSSGALFKLSDATRTEGTNPLTWTAESGPLKEYPVRVAVPALFADFTKAAANASLSWSHDGGSSWTTPVVRPLNETDKHPVRKNRLGLFTQHGLRVRLSISDDADFSFMGASVPDPEPRAP